MKRFGFVFVVFISFILSLNANEKDMLTSQLLTTEKADRASLLNEISYVTLDESPESAYNYAKQALELAETFSLQEEIVRSFFLMGAAKEHLNQYAEALDYLNRGLELAQKHNLYESKGQILLHFGIVYIRLAQYDDAMNYLMLAMEIFQDKHYPRLLAQALNHIGNVHYYIGNFQRALDYYQQTQELFSELNDIRGLARALNSIGSIYNTLGDNEKALEYALESIEQIEKTDDKKLYVSFLNNTGIIYKNIEKYDEAFEYYNRALEIKKDLGDKKSIATSYLNIANLYFHLSQNEKAMQQAQLGYEYIQDIPANRLLANFLKLISYIHYSLGDHEKAFLYFRQYDVIREELYTEDRSKWIAEMDVKYETDRKMQQILLLEKDKEINNMLRSFFIVGILLLALIAFVLYSRYRLKYRANQALRIEIFERIRVEEELEKAKHELEERVAERTAELATANIEIEKTQKEILFTLGEVVETRSEEVSNHVKRVAVISKLMAEKVGLSNEEVELLKMASPMHDVGKIGIPDSILNKPGKLTVEEFEIMKEHTVIGNELLKSSKRKILRTAAIIALQHHEQWDGFGYPSGLKGEEIHIFARITQLADIFDALYYKRTYKDNWELDQILDFIKEERGQRLDPKLVDIFIANIDEFIEAAKLYPDEAMNF